MHARNGRGCRQYRGRRSNRTAKGCNNKLPWLRQVEQRKRKQTPHRAPYAEVSIKCSQVESTQSSSTSLHDAELRVFSPHASFLCHSTSARLRGKRSRRHNNSSKQQQSQPNILAVTVIVVALGLRCTLSLSQPPPSLSAQLLILLTSRVIHKPESACILPGVVL